MEDRERKRSGGRLPKYLKKSQDSEHSNDPWVEFRPLKRTWECEKCKFDIKRDPDLESIDLTCPLCGGKFVKTNKIERALKDPYTEYRWILFLESRKGKGKEQFLEIQSTILNRESEYEGGWVPYSEIVDAIEIKCPVSKYQLDRLMNDMLKFQIVYKSKKKDPKAKGINKNRVFYKYNSLAAVRTTTTDGYKKEYFRLFTQNLDLSHRFIHATAVLFRHGLLQEYHEDLRKWDEQKTPSNDK